MEMEAVGTERWREEGKKGERREGRKERQRGREKTREFKECVPFATIPLMIS